MAKNPFLSSPFEISTEDSEVSSPSPVASRGVAPSTHDIIKRAEQLDIDPKLALSFFTQESSGNFNSSDSSKGARGGFQVMPGTYRSMMGTEAGQRDPWMNMEAGLRYIRYGQDTLKTRDPELLAAGYHAGYDRNSLKNGVIPNVSDGAKNTRDYAREVAARVRGERPSRFPDSQPKDDDVLSQLNKDKPGLFSIDTSEDGVDPVLQQLNAAKPGLFSIDTSEPDEPTKSKLTQAEIDNQSYFDRLYSETKTGFGDMTNSLATTQWALGGGDSTAIAEQMAKSLQQQANAPKTTDAKEIDQAYQGVTDAKGVIDTTVAGAKALAASVMHPKETSIEIARNAANSLPTIGVGAAGAGAGALGGSVVPGFGTAAGAVLGGRAGMALGTTAVEFGSEIQHMVQKRLVQDNAAPTAQNILAIIDNPDFKAQAQKQGLAKGLTVAAVDQIFLGVGGKIATAPAKKMALKELEEQGADLASRAARNEALASPAGRAALEAAKPSVAAKVGAGTAAVGVDAVGESIGEGLSQKVARGEVDYGDALREGVVSVGQSVAQTAAGTTIEQAKMAGTVAKDAIRPSEKAPSSAAGPLERAAENAAAQPERVTVTAPDGQVSGTVTGTSPDGKAVQIVGDDGQVYNFATGANGVSITPEAPNTPLTNAVEVAAEGNAVNPLPETIAPQAVVTPAPVEAQTEIIEPAAPTKALDLPSMEEAQLRDRLRYIADQARTNGGWNKMLVEQRRAVEKEINARVALVQTPKIETPQIEAAKVETPALVQETPALQAAATLPKDLAGAKPRYSFGNKQFELKFASDFDRAAYIAAQDKPSKRDADYLSFAMAQSGLSEADVRAHGAQVREAIKAQAKTASPGTLKVPEVGRGATQIEKTPAPTPDATLIDEATKSAPTAETKAPDLTALQKEYDDAAEAWQLSHAEPVGVRLRAARAALKAALPESKKAEPTNAEVMQAAQDSGKLEVINVADKPAKLPKASKEDVEHLFGVDKKRAAALERIAKGTAYFGTPEKAKDFIIKNGLGDTHTVEQTGKVRFEVKAKAEDNTALIEQLQEDGEPVTSKMDAEKRFSNGERIYAVHEQDEKPKLIRNIGEMDGYTADQLMALPSTKENNVTDERTSGEPASAEAVVEETNAGQAEGAAVQSAPEKAPSEEEVSQGAYSLPEDVASDWRGEERADFKPTERQQAIMDAVGQAIDAGKFYTTDVVAFAAEKIGVTPEQRKQNTLGTENGDFGYDVYHARRAVEAQRKHNLAAKIAGELNLQAGDKLGTIVFNDFKINTNVTVESVSDDGQTISIKGKRGSYVVTATTSPIDIKNAIERAIEKGKRKDTYEEFVAARNTTPQDQLNTVAEGNDNGPQKLDQSGSGELEGQQSDALQGAEPQREAGSSPEGSGGTDLLGDERAGSLGVQPVGSVGNDAGEVPSLAARRNAGRGSQQGGEPVQRGKRPAKSDIAGSERDRGNQPELIPTEGIRAQDRSNDFVITDEDAIGEGGAKTKFKQNIAAIRLLKELNAANRQATRAEQAVLAKYVGWGGIPQAFYRDNNEVTKGWEKEAAELKDVMTADELSAAAASTRNAHYTSPEIVGAVWDAAKRFGFQGGRTLEPSVGVGNFFGLMPTALRSASQLTGVELDHITGGIAKQLYPQANIAAPVGFQDFSAPDNYFELAIGNPPFGRESIYDAVRRSISGFSIHNYFFAKSIDTLRPNGVLAMVVTNRLLDSVGDKARSYIANRTEFLGAIRLPNDAFLKNAGTQVTTDIIFLRKLKDGEQPTGQRWTDVKQFTDANGKTVPLNEYFIAHPDMMLGDFGAYGSIYSPDDAALVAHKGQDTPALLQEAVAKLPQGFMDAPTLEPTKETIEATNDISRVKVGSVFEQDGQIYERREDLLGKQQAAPVTFASDKARERVTGMIKVRDALIDVRGMQLSDSVDSKALEAARAALNKEYDTFVKANGPLNADANKRLMRDDPTWPQIAALEDKFDKGISAAVAKTTGEKARAPSAQKSAIFTKRTQSPYHAPQSAKSAKDAMVSSLSERGRVDLDYMASLYAGHSPEEIAKELSGLIYRNPVSGWESREQYLSGNVKKKLAQALEAVKGDPSLKANVEALKAVQPADIEAIDIDVKTGAHWVPADVMQEFITHISEGQNAKAIYNPVNATWTLNIERVPQSALTQWGTDRTNVLKVLEAAANQKQIQVFDNHSDGSRTLNEAATTAANEKVERVKAEWRNWIWSDDARRERLASIYNDTFNTDVQRDFDGSHLKFPGKVGDDIIELRPHQKNAVWRILQSGTSLLDHVVGAGKTFTVIAATMEMRRMGLAKKPMLAVPNHLVGQWAEDFMKLYPGANILAATKKDFEKDNRKRLFARIATGDWDAVIVAHSSIGKVEVEPQFQEAFIKQQIEDMDTSIAAMRAAEGKSSRNVKQIEKQKANLEEKLKKLFDTGSKDNNLYFGELGIDAFELDEAHEFKNLGFSTGMQRVAGLGNPMGSNKAADMFMKVQSVLKRTGGKNVVFATGTPISNTMAEMYTMQRYLDYANLKEQGIAHFDAWAKTFGEVVTDWELSPSGQYKMNSRFAKFVNMPELMQRYQSFADVVNRDDIDRMLAVQGKKLPVPKVVGGKPENTVVERSADQAAYIGVAVIDEQGNEQYPEGSLIWRSEHLPKKAEKGADNMLKIMSDARKAALDMRLIDPNYPDNPNSKVNVAARNIKAIHDKWEDDKGAQLVFIDLSTPKGAVAKEAAALRDLVDKAEQGDEAAQEKLDAMSPDELLALDAKFSVYDDLKQKLIGLGIPESQIAFIHDANTELQKEDLFGKVRSGRIRVLLGSTAKMGAGMNVQERLVALHHLDAPWRPSDLEQREGRIIRQGNALYDKNPTGFEVEIKRYATKQTLDSRMWQTIEAKARFIEQVRKGTGEREVEDVAGEAANSAEMKAASSGNPLILEEMSLRQSIRKLENQQSEHKREQYRVKDRIRMLADTAKRNDREAGIIEADVPLVPKEFLAKIGKQTFDKPGEAGEAVLAAVAAMHKAGEDDRDIGTYGGFKLTVDDTTNGVTPAAVLTARGKGEYQVEANPGSSAVGLGQRLANTLRGLAVEAKELRAGAERYRNDIPKLEQQIKPWGREAELNEAKARHMSVIEQLKPKKKPEAPAATLDGETPAMSRSSLEVIFAGLESKGSEKKQALAAVASHENADAIRFIDDNFWTLLGELEDSGKVDIKC